MSRPTIGNVIDASISADVSECSLEDACQAILDKGNIPRAVIVSPDNFTAINNWAKEQEEPSQGLTDIARKFGLVVMLDQNYVEDEWAVTDLVPGNDGNTYWNPGPFG